MVRFRGRKVSSGSQGDGLEGEMGVEEEVGRRWGTAQPELLRGDQGGDSSGKWACLRDSGSGILCVGWAGRGRSRQHLSSQGFV